MDKNKLQNLCTGYFSHKRYGFRNTKSVGERFRNIAVCLLVGCISQLYRQLYGERCEKTGHLA
jgi:hypothetical protein